MPTDPTLTVCRGCCCGTDEKTDPTALLERLLAACGSVARVRTSDCLGPCERSDVVVVSPTAPARACGARTVWVARVNDPETVDAVAQWVLDGGPGRVEPPPRVRVRMFRQQATTDGGS